MTKHSVPIYIYTSISISAENRFQIKDRLIRQLNEQSSINNRLLSLCVPPGHSSMKAMHTTNTQAKGDSVSGERRILNNGTCFCSDKGRHAHTRYV